MSRTTPADRIEAKRIVAVIWSSAEGRLGRPPSPTELARWARVYALAALGLDAVAGQIEDAGEEPVAKTKRAKAKALPIAKPVAKPAPTRGAARLAGRRVLVPEQLALLDTQREVCA